MVKVGVMIRVEAKPDKAAEVEAMLRAGVEHVEREGAAVVWLALRLGPTTFAVVDAFRDDAGRQAHVEANLASLRAAAPELFTGSPLVEYTDVLAALLPGK